VWIAGKFQMCFHEKAVRSRWCLSPVLKCSVGTLRALCIHCVRVQAEACCFHGMHFGFASVPSNVIFKYTFLTKWHYVILAQRKRILCTECSGSGMGNRPSPNAEFISANHFKLAWKDFVKSLTEKYFNDNMKNALLWLTIQ